MAGQLIPPPDLAPSVPKDCTPQQCIALWLDLMRTADKLLMAGLRREVGPEGDIQAAYREWYAQDREQHDRTVARMMQKIKHCGGSNAE